MTAYDKAGNSASSNVTLVVPVQQTLLQKVVASGWLVYAFALSIWLFLLAILILLVILIKRHKQTTNKAAEEIEHMKKDVDKELEHLKRHIHIQLDALGKQTAVTVPETKALRKKLLASIKKLDDMVMPPEEQAKTIASDLKKIRD